MNHVYRLVWSQPLGALVPVAEIAGAAGRSNTPRRRHRVPALLAAFLAGLLLGPPAWALPSGGQVVSGKASVHQSGSSLTVDQGSAKAILDWQRFGIGPKQSVTFHQPGASSVALNRVIGSDPSAIYGALTANGQLFLVNPNGIEFAPGASVNVGGLVASTLGISNQDFLDGNYAFSGQSTKAVVNEGKIRAAQGGYVALIGRTVTNDGSIATPGGTAALGAGGSVELTLADNHLLHFAVSRAALNAQAANGGVIHADGGRVVLSAKAKDALLRTVVNNTGVIRARGVEKQGGSIVLTGGESGITRVSGTLDARPTNNGPAGTIETSGAHLVIGQATVEAGAGGLWLLDPTDLTIGSTAAGSIETALNNGTSVTEQTTNSGTNSSGATNAGSTSSGKGDINVEASIAWSANGTNASPVTLTLSAYHSINLDAPITASGSYDKLVLTTDNNAGGTSSGGALNVNAPVTLSGTNAALTINGTAYTVIQSMGALQNMSNGLSGHYALGENLTQTSNNTTSNNFTPVGSSYSNAFTGTFEGLGHTITNLTISSSGTNVGLFGAVGTNGTVRDVGLVGGSVSGSNLVGDLAGRNRGTITDAYATGSVSGSNLVGGLVGSNSNGTITDAYATGSVKGGSTGVGGLVGLNSNGTITDAYATGSVSGTNTGVGGLVGSNYLGTITDAYATGSVTGSTNVGGLVGSNGTNGQISNAYWDTSTDTNQSAAIGTNKGTTNSVSGLTTAKLASNLPSGFSSSVWGDAGGKTTPYLLSHRAFATTGPVLLASEAGSSSPAPYHVIQTMGQLQAMNRQLSRDYVLVDDLTQTSSNFTPIGSSNSNAFNGIFEGFGHTITNLTINAPSRSEVGLFGWVNSGGGIQDVGLVGGSVSGASVVGDLVGFNNGGSIMNAYATGDVSGSSNMVGGLVGENDGTIADAYATGAVSGSLGVGGLVGDNSSSSTSIIDAYATGSVSGTNDVGGLAGINYGTISNTYATGGVSLSGSGSNVGGVVGSNQGTVSNGYWDTTTDTNQSAAIGTNTGTTTTNSVNGLTTATLASSLPSGFSTNAWGDAGGRTTPYLLGHRVFTTTGPVFLGSETGSNPAPYHAIQTMAQLQSMGSHLSRNYALVADLTQSSTNFTPVGSSSNNAFIGTFEGLDHTITNLTISAPSTNYVGLFGYVGKNGTIRDVGLVGGSVSGGSYSVGALVGFNDGTITHAYATGPVSGTGYADVGGLVGSNDGTVTDAYATGGVSGSNFVGGLVGVNNGSNAAITDAYATGRVHGSSNYVGGLVGFNEYGTVSNAYATGSVSGSSNVGGLVGLNEYGAVSNAYATGSVSGNNYVGGLVGSNYSGTITDGYFDTTTDTNQSAAIGSSSSGTTNSVNGLTTAALASNLPSGFSSTVWGDAGGRTTPYLLEHRVFATTTGPVLLGSETGSSPAPYHAIQTMVQLQSMNRDPSRDYVLVTDLTQSSSNFTRVGSYSSQFTGTFEGLNHTITNLTISSPGSNVGLFGWVGTNGTIRDVGLVGGSVSGGSNVVGDLVGYNSNGTITDAYATGSVSGRSIVGGLVGINRGGTITDAYATGSVSGSSNEVGGLIGESDGTISNAYATGRVNGSYEVGGLAGVNGAGTITDAYATGSVSGTRVVGGLAGANYSGTITDAYATGGVSGSNTVGGLVGDNSGSNAAITDAYATGSVSGSSYVGGLVGVNSNGGTITNAYWDTSTDTNQSAAAGTNHGTTTTNSVNGLTTATLASSLPSGFSTNAWGDAGGRTTPYLLGHRVFTTTGPVLLGSETGATPAPYHAIQTMAQLQDMNRDLSRDYVLVTDLTQSSTNFTPVGGSNSKFIGTFEGLDHTITNLTIASSGTSVGLFGFVGTNGVIQDVGLVGGSVSGKGVVGELVGGNFGTIKNAYATGNVHGTGVVGGLDGGNTGTITDAYATGSVSGSNSVGGLVGVNSNTGVAGGYPKITDAYATGSVSGSTNVGGLVGRNSGSNAATISDAYATGSVSGTNNVGGLVGANNTNGQISNAYWDTSTDTNQSAAIGTNTGTTNSVSGLSTAKLASNLPSGFSSSVWGDAGGRTTPYLLEHRVFATTTGPVFLDSETGSSPAPYHAIQTMAQLQSMGSHLSRNYALVADLTQSSTNFTPVGSSNTNAFTGTFDGLGHTITNLTISSSGSNVGLFGYVGTNGAIRDVGLVGGSVSGKYNVGDLVGSNYAGTITDAYATGSVSGTTNVGGLVGSNDGPITDAYATGSVNGSYFVGGLVGLNAGTITDGYATGSVSGTTGVGGLVGFNVGTVSNAYATGGVSGSGAVGGLSGLNSNGGTITDAYATGSVRGSSNYVGGLVGSNTTNGQISNAYWDTSTDTNQSAAIGTNTGTTNSVSGLTTAQLAATLPSGFSTNAWGDSGGRTTPYLLDHRVFATTTGPVFLDSETGSSPAPYHAIQTMAQLQSMGSHLSRNYALVDDLTHTSSNTTSNNFVPVGGGSSGFTGTFEGLGHTITNLTINEPSNGREVGLFGINVGGTIRDVGLVGGSVSGGNDVGDLVGYNYGGTISNAYATGSVSGGIEVGGLVGRNRAGTITDAHATGAVSGSHWVGGLVGGSYSSTSSATITDAYATGDVSGTGYGVGGLVGGNDTNSTISNAYATGAVSGSNEVGGLVGTNYAGANSTATITDAYATGSVSSSNSNVGGLVGWNNSTISNAYATGAVSGTNAVGGLLGSNSNGTIKNAYWDTTTTGQVTAIGASGTNATTNSVTGLTDTQMHQQSSFGNFDFSTPVWVIYDGHTTPLLNAFLTPLTVTAGNASQVYDGKPSTVKLASPTYSVSGAGTSGELDGLSTPYAGDVDAGTYQPDLWSGQQGYRITVSGGTLTIRPRPLTASIVGDPTRLYNGKRSASLTPGDYRLSGVAAGDSVNVSWPASGTYASAGPGAAIPVTATLTASDFHAKAGTKLSNYALPAAATGVGTITPATPTPPGGTIASATPQQQAAGATARTLEGGRLQSGNGLSFLLDPMGTYRVESEPGKPPSVTLHLVSGGVNAPGMHCGNGRAILDPFGTLATLAGLCQSP